MRGQSKTIKSIIISGNVYLKNCHDEEISKSKEGDIYLYLNDEEKLYPIILNNYQSKGHKGYFKAKIYDGRDWCLLDTLDFFEDRVHQFGKNEICIYTFEICLERLKEEKGSKVYRTYREHYSKNLHESNQFKGKKTIKF
ncbi:MAG: hypothetical protein AABY27_01500 [Pseudomonadota bacterium]